MLGRAQCQAASVLAPHYQQAMLSAPFLSGSLHTEAETYGRVLFTGLGARSIAAYIYQHFFRIDVEELILPEQDQYLSKVWFKNPNWKQIISYKIRNEEYDAIFIDTCLSSICPSSRIIELAAQLNKTLKKTGVLVVNVNAATKNMMHRTLKRVTLFIHYYKGPGIATSGLCEHPSNSTNMKYPH